MSKDVSLLEYFKTSMEQLPGLTKTRHICYLRAEQNEIKITKELQYIYYLVHFR